MRCYICDFCDSGNQSSYYETLSDYRRQSKKHRFCLVNSEGKEVCNVCHNWSKPFKQFMETDE